MQVLFSIDFFSHGSLEGFTLSQCPPPQPPPHTFFSVHSTSAHTHTHTHTHTHMASVHSTSIYCAWHWEVLWESPGRIKHHAHP